MKIDILDERYWSPELFWEYRVTTSVTERCFGGPGKRWGALCAKGRGHTSPLMGLCGPPNPSHVTWRGGGASPRAATPPGLGASFPGVGAPKPI